MEATIVKEKKLIILFFSEEFMHGYFTVQSWNGNIKMVSLHCCSYLQVLFLLQSLIVFSKPIKFSILFTFGNVLAVGR